MENRRVIVTCNNCGRVVECGVGELPCEMLKGWINVSQWGGQGVVSQYQFCSFSCLKYWLDKQVPGIPKVFLESLKEDSGSDSKE
ncbi:hypothetical protein ACFLTP_04155 [Chloroflexota bacterium]